jgi:RNA polymerase sigma-70 factor (ECF subfamily)
LLVSKEPGAEVNLEREERLEWIRRAVDSLPEQLRAALALVYYQGLKYREAAEVLGVPVGTIKSRMHTALLKLNEVWQENHPTEGE